MPFFNRIDISPYLDKAPELRRIRDSLYSIRETLKSLQRKGLKTKNNHIQSQLFSLCCALDRCKNEERMYHYFHNMDRALGALKRELNVVTRLHQNLYETQNYGFSPQVEQKAPELVPPQKPRPIKPIVIVPRERPEVTAYLITSYNKTLGYGNHSALYIHVQGEEPYLYDPGGGYLSGRRGSGAFFIGEEANLKAFIQYHINDGDDVVTRPMTLSKAQAESIINKSTINGEEGNFSCAINVSLVLMDDYGIKEIYRQPINLDKAVQNIERTKGIK